jgi:CO/xanthine dehydrogenase Mo-binding subunit
VADVRDDSATIYTASQSPFGIRRDIAQLLGLPEEHVRVISRRSSGTYGRNAQDDAPAEAARLSRAVRRPVLLQWTREEEFAFGSNRPEASIMATAGLDAVGNVIAWRYRIHTNVHVPDRWFTSVQHQTASIGASEGAVPAYRIPAVEVDLHLEIAPIRTAAFRSLAGAENLFAIESLMDELAAIAGEDPLAFRLRHLEDDRMRRLLELVAERSGWVNRPRGNGRGYGLACGSFAGPTGTQIAQVASVAVDAHGRVRLERMWCAIDPGLVVNPNGVRNQVEGAMQQAASVTLIEQVHHKNGRVVTTSWDTYPIATFRDVPAEIDVVAAGDPARKSTGVGEVGTVPVAAAIANAVFAASGARVRELPITTARVRAAIAAAGAPQTTTSR